MRDYRLTSGILGKDLQVMLSDDPDAFNIRIYIPTDTLETVTDVADVVGNLEKTDRSVTYLAPIDARAFSLGSEFPFFMPDAGTGASSESFISENPVILLVSENAPNQSVIQYDEYIENDTPTVVTLYVLRGEAVGQAPVFGYKLYCIPMIDNDEFV